MFVSWVRVTHVLSHFLGLVDHIRPGSSPRAGSVREGSRGFRTKTTSLTAQLLLLIESIFLCLPATAADVPVACVPWLVSVARAVCPSGLSGLMWQSGPMGPVALGVLAVLCRGNAALQTQLQEGPDQRLFYRLLVNNLKHSDFHVIVCSLSVLASAVMDAELGQCLFSPHNISQVHFVRVCV